MPSSEGMLSHSVKVNRWFTVKGKRCFPVVEYFELEIIIQGLILLF